MSNDSSLLYMRYDEFTVPSYVTLTIAVLINRCSLRASARILSVTLGY